MSDAATYNRIRRIIFSTYHDPLKGPNVAKKYLEGYYGQLGHRGFIGLKAEVTFYERHARDYDLTVAGDVGEHADFAGVLKGNACRFDVATTLNFKRWEDYEPHLGNGPKYKVAVLNSDTFELVDVLDLGFRRCECGGHLIPFIALLGQNYNDRAESTWSNDQLLMDICTSCNEYFERERFTSVGVFSPQEISDAFIGEQEDGGGEQAARAVQDHALGMYKHFRRQADDMLMAVAQKEYVVTERDGGGHWALQMLFTNGAVADELPHEIECPHDI